ncbi:MAG: rhomboid family intramembrane serine protease [Desulfuromonas sp.]|nr:MAG: rhomboid family intramembrane serine protease [Desulfuromonas sp.]
MSEGDDLLALEEAWQQLSLPGDELLATGRSARQLRPWVVVLEARGIDWRQTPAERGGWSLEVPTEQFESAQEELALYAAENRNWPPPLPPPTPLRDNMLATLSILVLVATFYNLTQLNIDLLGHHPVLWNDLGCAAADLIRQGEWWRLVTALTLHADHLHLLGNIAIGGVFIVRLSRDLGGGLAWSLVLSSGILGNLLNAWLHNPAHRSVGASTAVFGCVGILAAMSLVRYRRPLQRRWPLPVAAGLGLLALLGSAGERTDLGAHLFGFAAGLLLGALCEVIIRRTGRPTPLVNTLLALTSATTILGAWYAALLFGVPGRGWLG